MSDFIRNMISDELRRNCDTIEEKKVYLQEIINDIEELMDRMDSEPWEFE